MILSTKSEPTLTKLSWFQRLLCHFFCPRWKEDRPLQDKGGYWMACSLKVSFRGREEVDTQFVQGLHNAYEVARWLAFMLDRKLHPDLGVDWAVRRPTEEEYQARGL